MNISLLDINRLIDVNNLKEVTSGGLLSNKLTYDPDGILSTEIFGISKSDRRGTFAWIDLKRPFVHPHVYHNILKRIFRGVIFILAGQRKYTIVDGLPKEDPNGWTGLAGLYDHWEEIDWTKHPSANKRSLTFLATTPKDQIFITRLLVCPPAYRDIVLAGTTDTSDHVSELNNLYTGLIRQTSRLQSGGLFDRLQYATQSKIQDTLCEINIYFQGLISKKRGLIRKHLLGKTVDFGTRSVISAPSYNNERLDQNMVDLSTTAMPISQCCSTFYPFIESWLIGFFTREILNNPQLVNYIDPESGKQLVAVAYRPEIQFSEKVVRKMIHNYVFNPDDRFKIITIDAIVPELNNKRIKAVLGLRGKVITAGNTVAQDLMNRAMTVTDLLYLACVESCEKRHCMITRYPVGVDKGLFFNKIRVQSTINHVRVEFNGKVYPYYPHIDFKIPHHKIGVEFIDTLVFSNSLLAGMGGDYDGDQVSLRGIWTDEANAEAETIMNSKMSALNINGSNSRVVEKEIYNAYYELTKEPETGKLIPEGLQSEYLNMEADDFTRSFIAKMLAHLTSAKDSNNTARSKPKHRTWERITVPEGHFFDGHKSEVMTIGRYLFNKYVLYGASIIPHTGIINTLIHKSKIQDIDDMVGKLLLDNKINRDQFNNYIDRRDNLGYWLNGMLAHTISAKMLKPLKEIEVKKAELMKKYEKEIAEGNIDVMTDLTNELVAYAKELLKDDPGMDLYLSGDLNFDNNYRSNAILKGAVMNKITNEFDFISSSFMSGIHAKDIPAHANSILSGAYPSAVATKKSGYMGKKLLALLQMISIDEPGTDCGSKNPIPIVINKKNKKSQLYSYIVVGNQLLFLDENNIDEYVGKTVMMRSPMSCLNDKICSKCAGEMFYKLEVENAGLFAVQISYTALNLGLKAKHDQSIELFQLDPDTMITPI